MLRWSCLGFEMIEISNDPIFTTIIANPKKIKIDAINKYIVILYEACSYFQLRKKLIFF